MTAVFSEANSTQKEIDANSEVNKQSKVQAEKLEFNGQTLFTTLTILNENNKRVRSINTTSTRNDGENSFTDSKAVFTQVKKRIGGRRTDRN